MPYACKKVGSKYYLTKKTGGDALGKHDTLAECNKQMRAVYASESRHPKNIVFDGYISIPYDLNTKIAESDEEIRVVINSSGGSFLDAMYVHNKLRNAGKPIVVYVESVAFSAAADIMLAGDKVYIAENGLIQFHPVEIDPGKADEKDLVNYSEMIGKMNEMLVNTMMSKTKRSKEECQAVIQNDTWFTPTEALAFGLVDEIVPILRDYVEVENFFPERIVNFITERNQMPLKELCDEFGLTVTAENAETELRSFIKGLQSKQPKAENNTTNLPPGLVKMLKSARETEVSLLLSDAKISAAVSNELKLKFLTDERIKKDIAENNEEFNDVISLFTKNEKVLNFGGSNSGTQRLPPPENSSNANLLVKDMESRGKE